jgi:hypothetical protein
MPFPGIENLSKKNSFLAIFIKKYVKNVQTILKKEHFKTIGDKK